MIGTQRGVYIARIFEDPTMVAEVGSPAWRAGVANFFVFPPWTATFQGKTYSSGPNLASLNLERFAGAVLTARIFTRGQPDGKPVQHTQAAALQLAVATNLKKVPHEIEITTYVPTSDRMSGFLYVNWAPQQERARDGSWYRAMRVWWEGKDILTVKWKRTKGVTCTPEVCLANQACVKRGIPSEAELARAEKMFDVPKRPSMPDDSITDPSNPISQWRFHADTFVQMFGANYGTMGRRVSRHLDRKDLEKEMSNSQVITIGKILVLPNGMKEVVQVSRDHVGGIWQLFGCTGIMIASDTKVWTAHIWENAMAAGELVELYWQQMHKSYVRDFLYDGHPHEIFENPDDIPRFAGVGLRPLVQPGGSFDPKTRKFIKVYILAPSGADESPPTTVKHQHATTRVVNQLMELLSIGSAQIQMIPYQDTERWQRDSASNSARLVWTFTRHFELNGETGYGINVYWNRALIDTIFWNGLEGIGTGYGGTASTAKGFTDLKRSGIANPDVDLAKHPDAIELRAKIHMFRTPMDGSDGPFDLRHHKFALAVYVQQEEYATITSEVNFAWGDDIALTGSRADSIGERWNIDTRLRTMVPDAEDLAVYWGSWWFYIEMRVNHEMRGPRCDARQFGALTIDGVGLEGFSQTCYWLVDPVDWCDMPYSGGKSEIPCENL